MIRSIWIITSLKADDTPKGCTAVVQHVAYVNDAAMTRRYRVQFCSSALKVYTGGLCVIPNYHRFCSSSGPVVLQRSPAAPLCSPYTLFGSTGLSAAAGDGVAVLRHSAIYPSECFALGLEPRGCVMETLELGSKCCQRH